MVRVADGWTSGHAEAVYSPSFQSQGGFVVDDQLCGPLVTADSGVCRRQAVPRFTLLF